MKGTFYTNSDYNNANYSNVLLEVKRISNNGISKSYNIELSMQSVGFYLIEIFNHSEVMMYYLFPKSFKITNGVYYSSDNKTFIKSQVILNKIHYDEYEKLEYNKIKGVYSINILK